MEKLLPSAEVAESEEVENEDESEEEEEEDDDDDDYDDEKGDDGDEGEDGRDEEEAMTQAKDKTEKSSPPAKPPKEKKVSDVLNLNNEVVKMRKEVKRLRALIIRKLIRHIGDLKKKKGNKAAVEKNQRRAARLLEEIYAMKALLPDQVTKTALQKDLNFEQVCKNPKSTISDRAIARIATHPQFNKKIVDIKAAVKAFKEERMKSIKQGRKQKVENEAGNVDHQLPDIRTERKSYKEEEDNTMQLMNMPDKADDVIVKCAVEAADSTVAKPEKDTGMTTGSANLANVQQEEMPKPTIEKPTSTKSNEVKDAVKKETQNKNAGKKLRPAVLQEREDEEESDLESSDEEEKQYFDDSTEERFHKQSSQSEESEDDDFFVGKVSKFKKKKQKGVESENKVEEGQEVKKDSIEKVKSVDKVQSDLDALESRLKCKATSVFCRLSGFKESTGAGAGRGRGGDKFRGQRKPYDGRGLKSKAFPEGGHRESEKRGFGSAGRGRGRGRGEAIRQKMHTSSGAFSLQAPQQALHPSWEASKKRKEQQGQILAFQGKKIKFDDDDD